MSDQCAACGTSYEPGEVRALMADGTTVHETTQPASMRRCRDALLTKLANQESILQDVGNAETEGCQGCGTISTDTINKARAIVGWKPIDENGDEV